jgi:hypothetical protein
LIQYPEIPCGIYDSPANSMGSLFSDKPKYQRKLGLETAMIRHMYYPSYI